MNYYDIIIMGGGISGLYIQYKLLKKNKNLKILLIEKNKRIGGRIYTHSVVVKGIKYLMEGGAGRFNDNHKYLLKLINVLGYDKKIYEIPSNVQFIPTKTKWKNSTISKFSPYKYMDLIIKEYKINKNMNKISFIDWLKKNVDLKIISFLKDSYPYKDIFNTNTYDALNLYKRDLNINNTFYILQGGLSQLVESLYKNIIKNGGIIKLNNEVTSINNYENKYVVKTNKGSFFCNKVILTGQRGDLLKIKYLKPIKKLVNSVRNATLCRFYFIFDKKYKWFKNIKKTITDSKLSYFIPIDSNNGLVMISYVDEYNAKYLKKLENESKSKLINFLLKECEKIFGIKNIPKPIWTKSFYWNSGVGNWKVGSDSNMVEKNILKPFKNEYIYICGENYSSKYQSWIEGSLDTCEKVLNILFK